MVCTVSAGLGDPETIFGKPMGLVLERRTVPDLCRYSDYDIVRNAIH